MPVPAVTILKNYTNVTFGAPPKTAFALDKSCAPPAARGAAPKPTTTKAEALASGELGRYTGALRRYRTAILAAAAY